MKRKAIINGAAIMALTMLAPAVPAGAGYGYALEMMVQPARGRGGAMERLVDDLDLSPRQREAIEREREEHRDNNRKLRQILRNKRSQLRDELEKRRIDKRRIKILVEELAKVMGDQLRERVRGILALKDILTPEQFEKFQHRIKERIDDHKGGRRGGKHRGGGPFERNDEDYEEEDRWERHGRSAPPRGYFF